MPPALDIDAVVTVRSSLLPLYLILEDGRAFVRDQVRQTDFLTTYVEGATVALRSYGGDFLSVREGRVGTSRFLGATERFLVEMNQYQYSLRAPDGRFLTVNDKDNSVYLSDEVEDTGLFQLFSLMVDGMNVGKHLHSLATSTSVSITSLLDPARLAQVRNLVIEVERAEVSAGRAVARTHDLVVGGLLALCPELVALAAHPIVLQLLRRQLSPRLACSAMRVVNTDPRSVRMDLETTEWSVPHPFATTEWPPSSEQLNARVVVLLDDLDAASSTWAYLPPQRGLPQEGPAAADGTRLEATAGSCWIFLGPWWTTNSSGAGSFWKQEDAMARYKYQNGRAGEQERQSVRLLEIDFVREFVAREEQVDVAKLLDVASAEDEKGEGTLSMEVSGPLSIF